MFCRDALCVAYAHRLRSDPLPHTMYKQNGSTLGLDSSRKDQLLN